MLIFLKEILLQILIWSLNLIDQIMEILSKDLFWDNYLYEQEKISDVELFLKYSFINNLFFNICILTISLMAIFSIVAIIKVILTNKGSLTSIIGRFFIMIFSIIIVVIGITMSIVFSNVLLRTINDYFNIDFSFKISNFIFEQCVGEWYNDYSVNEIDFRKVKVNELLGDYLAEESLYPKKWILNGMINPYSFSYFESIISSTIVLISLMIVIVTIIKRVYEIILLYITMPFMIASVPLDDGVRIKVWIEKFIGKIIIAHISIIIINLFYFLFPFISQFSILDLSEAAYKTFKLLMLSAFAICMPLSQKLIINIFNNNNNSYQTVVNIHNEQKYLQDNNLAINNHRFIEK